ncbi:MAG: hypothetical protein KKA67_12500 [Spirochaetes bacterium]|nr:hypothetical protein [Spirochaetota bacterium]
MKGNAGPGRGSASRGSASRWSAALALATIATLATACGLVGDDGFPPWLSYAESGASMAAAASEAGIGGLRSISRLEYVPFVSAGGIGEALVVAYLLGEEGEALVALDPTTMLVRKAWKRASIPPLDGIGHNVKGTSVGFLSGRLEFDPADLDAAPLAIPTGAPPENGRIFTSGPAGGNYLIARDDSIPGEYRLAVSSFSPAYLPLGSSPPRALDSANTYFEIVDAEYLDPWFRVLVVTGSGGSSESRGYVVSFQSEAAMLGPDPLLEDADAQVTGPFPMGGRLGWLTVDGVVALSYGDRTRLARYGYGYPLALLDEVACGDGQDYSFLSFDPGGAWWFLHDRLRGRAYKLRTWWRP